MTTAAIRLNNVNKTFGHGEARVHVLHDISLTLNAGEMTLVVGPSGCGKTTLISIIAGILNVDDGEVNIFGTPLQSLSDGRKTAFRRENIGFIFQQFNLIPTLTATENVAVPLLIAGVKKDEALARSRRVLDVVGLADRADFLPVQLSGGQQQRVAIARALVREPKLIICDELTASLDSVTGHKVMSLLKTVAVQSDRCVIAVTHDNRIYEFGDRMVEMEDGRILNVRQLSSTVSP